MWYWLWISKLVSIVLLFSVPYCILWTPLRHNMQRLLSKPKVLLWKRRLFTGISLLNHIIKASIATFRTCAGFLDQPIHSDNLSRKNQLYFQLDELRVPLHTMKGIFCFKWVKCVRLKKVTLMLFSWKSNKEGSKLYNVGFPFLACSDLSFFFVFSLFKIGRRLY